MASMPFEENVCYVPLQLVDELDTLNKGKTALIYTPYDMSIGGGEKYFLEVMAFLIAKGYNVLLATHDTNYCQDKECVLRTAFALRVHIPGDFKYLPVSYRALKRLHATRFDVYYEMGNTRFPEFRNPAVLGMYQCQFPFDLDGPFSEQSVLRLSTFNLVIVNSRFTQSWYIKYSMPALKVMEDKNMRYPTIEVVYPPVELETGMKLRPKKRNLKRVKIVQLGRVFSGRQNKGHKEAISAIVALNANKTDNVVYELTIIGNIHPGFENYAMSLQKMARGHPITFQFGIPGKKLMKLLDEGDMIWHLTGMDITEENSDPASYEHFGISVVEGMSHGLVPVIYSKGGVVEIPGRFGYEVSNVGQLIERTQHAAHHRHDAKETAAMVEHVQQFSKLAFVKRLNHIIDRDYDNMPGVYACELLGKAVGPVSTSTGVALMAERSYRHVRGEIDTLIVPGAARKSVAKARVDKQLISSIERLALKSRRIASVCTGAFLMAEAGLLDGHTVVTHWGACGRLADEFPNLDVDPEPIFIRNGSVYSAAGKTAGIDLALALIEEDLGRDWALEVSRYMVVHLKRPGGQSQFSVPLQAQIKDGEVLNGLPTWITNNLGAELSVSALAERAGMSERNFTRLFRQELKTTPAKFVEAARLEAVRHRMEESTLPLETLARDLGFGSGERLRRAFQRRFGVNPDYYRDRFGPSAIIRN